MQEIERLLQAALTKLTGSLLTEMPAAGAIVVERTRDALARMAGRVPAGG